jgi:hypothetical protein
VGFGVGEGVLLLPQPVIDNTARAKIEKNAKERSRDFFIIYQLGGIKFTKCRSRSYLHSGYFIQKLDKIPII